MQVVCNTCGRRLEWSHKQDRRLAELNCPHCGGVYRKPDDYVDWGDPAVVRRFADISTKQLQLAVQRMDSALSQLHRIPQLVQEARDSIRSLREIRPRETATGRAIG